MRERLRDSIKFYTQRVEPPSMENVKRFCLDLTIAGLATSIYLASRQLNLPETSSTEAARNILMVGSAADMGVAAIAAGIRTIVSYSLFHQDRVSGAFERRSQLPPTLSS